MAHARTRVDIKPALLDVDNASKYLSTGTQHVRHLVEIGELDAIRDGRRFRITTASCDRYIEKLLANTQPPEPLAATPNGAKCVERKRRAKAVTARKGAAAGLDPPQISNPWQWKGGNPTDAGDRLDPPITISPAKVKRQ